MKSVYKITLLVGITILVSSCHNNAEPNYQYMPNMYEPVSYGTYSQADVFKGGKEGQLPVEGTINRGFETYEYPDTPEALIAVKAANLKSPLGPLSEKDREKAKTLFEIYCATLLRTALLLAKAYSAPSFAANSAANDRVNPSIAPFALAMEA